MSRNEGGPAPGPDGGAAPEREDAKPRSGDRDRRGIPNAPDEAPIDFDDAHDRAS